MSKYTNRGLLDLENYDSKEAVSVIVKQLKGSKEFIEQKGNKIYFQFYSKINQIQFFAHIRNVLAAQGYATTLIEEIDEYEIKERQKKLQKSQVIPISKTKSNKRNRIKSNYEKVHRNTLTRTINS